jgi:hypothetical protein
MLLEWRCLCIYIVPYFAYCGRKAHGTQSYVFKFSLYFADDVVLSMKYVTIVMCVMVSSCICTSITTIQFPLICVMFVTHVNETQCCISPSSICISMLICMASVLIHLIFTCFYIPLKTVFLSFYDVTQKLLQGNHYVHNDSSYRIYKKNNIMPKNQYYVEPLSIRYR